MNKLTFNKVISVIDTKDAEPKFAEENFSGLYSFSNKKLCDMIVNYLISSQVFNSHIDIGGSTGLLSKKLLELGYDSYTLDGSDYGWKNNKLQIDKARYCVIDLTKPLFSDKKFDLASCFEVTEHVPEENLMVFINNIKNLSYKLICTVHIGGVSTPNHITLKPLDFWLDLFSSFGKVQVLDINIPNEFEDSEFLEIVFND